MKTNKTKLSLTTDGTTITIEFDNVDVDLDQYFEAFKTLMIGTTFTETQFKHLLLKKLK